MLFSLLVISCKERVSEYGRFEGFTQGTTYSIIYEGMSEFPVEMVRSETEKILQEIDKSLSVYNDSSVISKINRNETDLADTLFCRVLRMSRDISVMTDGAFDVTVMPLVRAWGFGPDEHKSFEKSRLDSLLRLVGYNKITLHGNKVVKDDQRITIDVNAIAQGYTVDVICKRFDELGIGSYLVDVGGEVKVKGKKAGEPWKIGIDKPFDSNMIPGENLQAIVKLTDRALATSGNYRKFYVENGVKYSHTIDPKTGYPSKNRLLSASIFAHECATADGIATACMVMGPEKSIEFITSHKQFDAYLVYSDEKGDFQGWISDNLRKLIEEEEKIKSP